jgi:hypothetical protein
MRLGLWRQCLARYVIPELPGRWKTTTAILYREPVDWLLHAVVMGQLYSTSETFSLTAIVQLLPVPAPGLAGGLHHLMNRGPTGRRLHAPDSIDTAEPVMRLVLDIVTGEALPYLAKVPDLSAYITAVTEMSRSNPINSRLHEELFYAHLATGDQLGALRAAADVERTTRTDTNQWIQGLRAHIAGLAALTRQDPAAALDVLRTQAATTRTTLHIPTPHRSPPHPPTHDTCH